MLETTQFEVLGRVESTDGAVVEVIQYPQITSTIPHREK